MLVPPYIITPIGFWGRNIPHVGNFQHHIIKVNVMKFVDDKIKRATGQLGTAMARQRNDPLYKRMVYFRKQYYKYREMIRKKYIVWVFFHLVDAKTK